MKRVTLFFQIIMVCLLSQHLQAEIGTPTYISIVGSPGNLAYDAGRNKLYVTNNSLNRLEIVNLGTKTLGAPISVGSQPRGLDIDPMRKYAYVCNYGGMNLSKVDLDSKTEISRLSVPAFPTNIAISSDGEGQIRTGDYSNYRGYHFDGTNGSVGSQIENYWYDAVSTNKEFLLRSGYNWIKKYDASSHTWGPQTNIPGFGVNHWDWINTLAVSGDGKWTMVTNSSFTRILDENLNVYGTINITWQGLAIDSANNIAYGIKGNLLSVIDLERCLVMNTATLPQNIYYNTGYPESYQWTNLLLNATGSELYELNRNGITIIPTGIPEPSTLLLLGLGALFLKRKRS